MKIKKLIQILMKKNVYIYIFEISGNLANIKDNFNKILTSKNI